jgi:hypothetical protein
MGAGRRQACGFTSAQHPDECGGPRTLVAYARKHGSTAEIAEAITFELRRCGIDTRCFDAGDVHDLNGYDGLVLIVSFTTAPSRRRSPSSRRPGSSRAQLRWS